MKGVESPKKPLIYYYVIVLLILSLFNILVSPLLMKHQVQEVNYGVFMEMIENKNIEQVEVNSSKIVFTDKDNMTIYKTGVTNGPTLTEGLYRSRAKFGTNIEQARSPVLAMLPTFMLPMVVFIELGQCISRKLMQQMDGKNSVDFGVGRSNTRVYVQSTEGIHFDNVVGEDEAKESLTEIVDYLCNPKKYTDVDASMPKGLLLVGPPGTGRAMLAKAVARESSVPFFSIFGSESVETFVGTGASRVHDLFRQAKEKALYVVFTDEIDAIGKRRDGWMGGNDERGQALNQLLTEMDEFEGNNGIIILAATNRLELLDPALTRPGRFDGRVPVGLPDLQGCEAILKVHATEIKLADDVSFHAIARVASGASRAELANIISKAAFQAVRSSRQVVNQTDLEESIETVIAGYQKKNTALSNQEKWVVSYHEIGHALVTTMQNRSVPVQKITITPRTSGVLGYTMQVEEGDKYLMTRQEIENKVITFTGGQAAEEVAFGEITTGASNDIEQITRLARTMITRYGMSKEFDMVTIETVTNQYLGSDTSLAYSAGTQEKTDKKVVELVKRLYEKAKTILPGNRGKPDELAQFLYERETITGDGFMATLNQGDEKSRGSVLRLDGWN